MAETIEMIDAVRRRAGKTVLELLNTTAFDALGMDHLATVAEVDPGLLRRLFPDMTAVVDQGLRDHDDAILFGLADDFAEDPEASVREKILEGLIARYESYAMHKTAIRHLNMAACRNPVLGAMLIFRLNSAMQSLLEVAGGAGQGLIGMLRIKGLSAVALACQRDWMKDDTPDLAITSRALDKRLKQAESLALTFRLIPDSNAGENHGTSEF